MSTHSSQSSIQPPNPRAWRILGATIIGGITLTLLGAALDRGAPLLGAGQHEVVSQFVDMSLPNKVVGSYIEFLSSLRIRRRRALAGPSSLRLQPGVPLVVFRHHADRGARSDDGEHRLGRAGRGSLRRPPRRELATPRGDQRRRRHRVPRLARGWGPLPCLRCFRGARNRALAGLVVLGRRRRGCR